MCVGGSRPDLCVLTVPSVGLCNLNVSFSGEAFDSRTAESSAAPTTNGGSEETMVTPTPSRARTTEDLFAAIHRYYHAFSACHHLFSPVTRPHPHPHSKVHHFLFPPTLHNFFLPCLTRNVCVWHVLLCSTSAQTLQLLPCQRY